MARNTYSPQEHFPKQLETMPHLMQSVLHQVPSLTYLGISKFMLDKWIPLRQQMSSQIQADVRAVLDEEEHPSKDVMSKLASIEQLLALQISNSDPGGGSLEKLSSDVQTLSADFKSLTDAKVNQNPMSCSHDGSLQGIDQKVEELLSLVKAFANDFVEKERRQQAGQDVVDSIVNAVSKELIGNSNNRIELRCVCGVSEVEPKKPNTRSRRSQKKLLVFCEGCQAWHHGSCVGIEVPPHYSCTASEKSVGCR